MELPQLQMNTIANATQAKDGDVNIINVVGEDFKIEPGVASKNAGEAAFAALERAVTDLRGGDIDVLVTAPINKETIQSDTFTFPGHTEYLQSSLGDGKEALMILANERLRIALVTTHLPISKIADAITKDAVIGKLRIFNDSLKRDFNIDNPRIAVLSLNPHAGDNGLLGSEESEVIAPAIEQAHEEKIFAFGPYAADGFFGTEAYRKFDGVLAMYHDQGLAPFKTIAMDSGVNFTAGLPYVRTSPDHGTGFDIANQGKASEESMRQAIYMAIDTFRSRQRYEQAYANPLRRQYFDKGKDNVVLDLTKDDSAAQ
jgi:4-hydroxythreonine-4-phosphate dehydrogenase